jgi:hypothetical protein
MLFKGPWAERPPLASPLQTEATGSKTACTIGKPEAVVNGRVRREIGGAGPRAEKGHRKVALARSQHAGRALPHDVGHHTSAGRASRDPVCSLVTEGLPLPTERGCQGFVHHQVRPSLLDARLQIR